MRLRRIYHQLFLNYGCCYREKRNSLLVANRNCFSSRTCWNISS